MDTVILPKCAFPEVDLPMAALGGHDAGDMDYIRDGLVFHIDGINKGPNPDAWTDSIGEIQLPIGQNIINSNNVEVSSAMSCDVDFPYDYENATIEIAMRCENLRDWNNTFFSCGRKNKAVSAISFWNNYRFANKSSISGSAKWFSLPISKTYIISSNDTLTIANGKSNLSFENAGMWSAKFDFGFTTNAASYPSIQVYSLRIYNRHLSEEEMRHNQAIDIKRFGLNIEPSIMTTEYIKPQDNIYPH